MAFSFIISYLHSGIPYKKNIQFRLHIGNISVTVTLYSSECHFLFSCTFIAPKLSHSFSHALSLYIYYKYRCWRVLR